MDKSAERIEPIPDMPEYVPLPTPSPGNGAEAAAPRVPETVRQLALKHLDRFVSYGPKVLAGDDPDAIHDFRVASRRLQQVLDLLYPAPRPRAMRRVMRRIRRCRRAFGDVRDCDVMLGRVADSLTRNGKTHRESWLAVRDYVLARREESFQKGIRKVCKVNLEDLYLRLTGLLSPNVFALRTRRKPPQGTANPEQLHDHIVEELARYWQRLEKHLVSSHDEPRPSVIHNIRITSKRLRYLVEVVNTFGVLGSNEVLAWLRGLQQHLGEWHDLEIMEQTMAEMLARPEFVRKQLDLALGVGELILSGRLLKRELVEGYFEMTSSRGEYSRVRECVAYLPAFVSPSSFIPAGKIIQ
jgi:CHAD domain-containing protein